MRPLAAASLVDMGRVAKKPENFACKNAQKRAAIKSSSPPSVCLYMVGGGSWLVKQRKKHENDTDDSMHDVCNVHCRGGSKDDGRESKPL